ncbi:MAG: C40 family peptidase [Candidatus Protistobacter heckmanni]|nr:C40 family peptidase [Candidatus Protistobacter heckmanni]
MAELQASQTQTKPGLIGSAVASTTSMATSVASKAGDLVLSALSMIGVRYRFGGNTPDSGLDCSGFVRYVFNDTLGFLLPRRSAEMSKVGETISSNELKPGDLVFFNTMRHAFSHVGIYIGDNKFVHAPSRGQEIRIDDMKQAYWSQRYNGARRIEVVQASLQSKGGERISTGDPRIDAILDQMKRDGRL